MFVRKAAAPVGIYPGVSQVLEFRFLLINGLIPI
jgi:hypothetical protein